MASPFSKDTVADYNKVLKFPKDAAFTVPGNADKKMVWVPDESDFGYCKAELIKEDGSKRLVKCENGAVSKLTGILQLFIKLLLLGKNS